MKKTVSNRLQFSTPRVGFEPTTLRLTAECSTDWAKEEYKGLHLQNCIHVTSLWNICQESFSKPCDCWSSPHPISNSQLHALLHFHPCPIYLVVFKGVYFFRMGHLILRGASRLDAFSVYPFRTWLPGRRLGSLTGTPAVRPSRSSRTKDSSSQISYAHAG